MLVAESSFFAEFATYQALRDRVQAVEARQVQRKCPLGATGFGYGRLKILKEPDDTRFGGITTAIADRIHATRAAIAQCINQREQFVQSGVFPHRFWHHLVKRFERKTSDVTFGVGPYRWQLGTPDDLITEWSGGIRRGNAASGFASNSCFIP